MIHLYENANYSNDSEDSDVANCQYTTNNQPLDLEDLNEKADIKRYKDLRHVFPSRNDFQFDNGITISSDFDSGNLMNCEELGEDQTYKFMS